LNSLLRSRKL